jgi:hypothetical protein
MTDDALSPSPSPAAAGGGGRPAQTPRPRSRPGTVLDDADMWLVGQAALLLVKQGDMRAAEIARRLWQSGADRVEIDLPPCDDLAGVAAAHAALIRLAAAGRLELRQAQRLSRLLLNQGRVLQQRVEFEGFAERIAEIEAANRAQAADTDATPTDPEAPAPPLAKGSPRLAPHRRRGPSPVTVPAGRLSPCRPLPEPPHYPYEMAGGSDRALVKAPPPD